MAKKLEKRCMYRLSPTLANQKPRTSSQDWACKNLNYWAESFSVFDMNSVRYLAAGWIATL